MHGKRIKRASIVNRAGSSAGCWLNIITIIKHGGIYITWYGADSIHWILNWANCLVQAKIMVVFNSKGSLAKAVVAVW